MQLSESVYLIGSGKLGCGLSDPFDCNVYAVDCGGPVLVIDAGTGFGTPRLLANLVADGLDPARVGAVLLTHAHLDHCGGAAELSRDCNAPVLAPGRTAAALAAGDEDAISLTLAKRSGLYPATARLEPCPVATRLAGGDEWRFGTATIRAVATPGHSADHLSFLVRGRSGVDLFSGDALFHGGRVLMSLTPDCSPADCGVGLRRLLAESFEGLYPGHGLWAARGGPDHLALCVPYLDRLLLPPNLL